MKKYFVVISIIFLSNFGLFKPVQFVSLNVFSSSILFLRSLSYDVNDVLRFYSNIENIRKENIKLRSEILALETKNGVKISKENIINELENLQKIFNDDEFFKDKKIKYLRILFYDSFSSRLFLESEGNNIENGAEVLYGRNLVGIVVSSNSRILEVKLLSDRGFLLNSIIINSNKEKIKTVTSGELGDSLVIKNILSTENVKEGDMVYTSTTNNGVTPELIIGKVERLEGITSQTFRKASISKFYDLTFINFVGVFEK